MFINKLAKVPRSQILQLLPQIRVVKAFQSSLKKTNGGKKDNKDKSNEDDEKYDFFTKKKEESPEKKKEDEAEKEECRKKRRDSEDETVGVCIKYIRKKEEVKSKERKTVGTQMSPHQEARARSAYELSFGQRNDRKKEVKLTQ